MTDTETKSQNFAALARKLAKQKAADERKAEKERINQEKNRKRITQSYRRPVFDAVQKGLKDFNGFKLSGGGTLKVKLHRRSKELDYFEPVAEVTEENKGYSSVYAEVSLHEYDYKQRFGDDCPESELTWRGVKAKFPGQQYYNYQTRSSETLQIAAEDAETFLKQFSEVVSRRIK